MIYILIFCILICIFIAYLFNGRRIFSPWIIMMASFLPVVIIASINLNRWGVKIHFYTIFIIFISFACWGIGELIGAYPLSGFRVLEHNETVHFELPKWSCILSLIIGLIICVIYFRYLGSIAILANYTGSGYMLNYARYAQLYMIDQVHMPAAIVLGRSFVKGFALIALYCCLYNFMLHKTYEKICYYLGVQIPYIFVMLFSTGRTEFIYYVTYILVLVIIFLSQKRNWNSSSNSKILTNTFRAFVFVMIGFWIMGYFTGKSESGRLFSTISKYVGSPIVNLDLYLQNPTHAKYFGEETLSGISRILSSVGFNIKSVPFYELESESYGGFSSNVYTSIRRYYHDYGVFGLCLCQMALGILYSFNFNYIKKINSQGMPVILFSCFFYPIVESGIEERFLNTVVIARTIYDIVFIALIYKFVLIVDWGDYRKRKLLILR